MKIHYDCLFPFGSACAASQALRAANLQFASYPFDWVGGSGIVTRARLVANDFRHWLDEDLLEVTDVIHGKFNASIVRNRLTNISFCHDFPVGCYVKDELPGMQAKYARRIKRLYADVSKAKKALALYCEIPYRLPASDESLREAQRLLASRFPATEIDLLYFCEDVTAKEMQVRTLDDHITVVRLDYHMIEDGYVSTGANYMPIIRYLQEHVCTTDPRTEEERRTYDELKRKSDLMRFGAHAVERWINKRCYRLYRHLEKLLAARGVVPTSLRPLKLYGDHSEKRLSLNDGFSGFENAESDYQIDAK